MLADPWASRLVQDGQAAVLADLRQPDGVERWLGARGVHAAVFVAADSLRGERELVPVARALLRACGRRRRRHRVSWRRDCGPAAAGEEGDFALRVAGVRGVLIPDGARDGRRRSKPASRSPVSRARLPAVVKLPG